MTRVWHTQIVMCTLHSRIKAPHWRNSQMAPITLEHSTLTSCNNSLNALIGGFQVERKRMIANSNTDREKAIRADTKYNVIALDKPRSSQTERSKMGLRLHRMKPFGPKSSFDADELVS